MLSMLLRDWLSSRSRAVLETSLMTLLLFLRSDWVDRSAHLQINAALQPPPHLPTPLGRSREPIRVEVV